MNWKKDLNFIRLIRVKMIWNVWTLNAFGGNLCALNGTFLLPHQEPDKCVVLFTCDFCCNKYRNKIVCVEFLVY